MSKASEDGTDDEITQQMKKENNQIATGLEKQWNSFFEGRPVTLKESVKKTSAYFMLGFTLLHDKTSRDKFDCQRFRKRDKKEGKKERKKD